jgi:hypothetical protein
MKLCSACHVVGSCKGEGTLGCGKCQSCGREAHHQNGVGGIMDCLTREHRSPPSMFLYEKVEAGLVPEPSDDFYLP